MASGVRHTIHQCTANLRGNSGSGSATPHPICPGCADELRTEMSARVMLSPTCEDPRLIRLLQPALQHQILRTHGQAPGDPGRERQIKSDLKVRAPIFRQLFFRVRRPQDFARHVEATWLTEPGPEQARSRPGRLGARCVRWDLSRPSFYQEPVATQKLHCAEARRSLPLWNHWRSYEIVKHMIHILLKYVEICRIALNISKHCNSANCSQMFP